MKFWFASVLSLGALSGCGSVQDEHSTVSDEGVKGTPCGEENGIPIICESARVRTYLVRPDIMKKYTECGQLQDAAGYAADGYQGGPFEPYLKGRCKDQTYPKNENFGKFMVYGPFIALPKSGYVLATLHISLQEVATLYPEDWPNPDTAVFKVELYSASLGGKLNDYIYRLSDFTGKMPPFALRFWTGGKESSLAKGKSFPDKIPWGTSGTRFFPWAPVNWRSLEIGSTLSQPITDLEVRVQILHGEANPSLLGIDVRYTQD